MHKVYVYGTLMTGEGETVLVPGSLYDLGHFPGAKLHSEGSHFVAEIREVSDEKLLSFDAYEGYYADSPASSLYIRRPYLDGWIYEYNRTPSPSRLIPGGDWRAHAEADEKCIRHYYHQVD